MTDPRRPLLAMATTVALLLAACGGAATAPATAPAAASPVQPEASAAPSSAVATEGPVATPAESSGGGVVGAQTDACALVSADEAGGILGATGATAELTPGDFSYCMYRTATGDIIAATSFTARGGRDVFKAWDSGSGVQPVDGIGDDAVFDPSSATLFVIKGEAIYGVTAGIGSDPEAQRLEWAKAFAALAAGRI